MLRRLVLLFIGAVALILSGTLLMVFFVALAEQHGAMAFAMITIGLLVFGMAMAAWGSALRVGEHDEDLFEGERGLVLSMMVVVAIAIFGFFLYNALHLDFWQGMLDGARAGKR